MFILTTQVVYFTALLKAWPERRISSSLPAIIKTKKDFINSSSTFVSDLLSIHPTICSCFPHRKPSPSSHHLRNSTIPWGFLCAQLLKGKVIPNLSFLTMSANLIWLHIKYLPTCSPRTWQAANFYGKNPRPFLASTTFSHPARRQLGLPNHPRKSQPTRDQPQPAVCGFGKTSQRCKKNEDLGLFWIWWDVEELRFSLPNVPSWKKFAP